MARQKKPDSPPPSKAYLVSFGDTMTTLLAFFIVLCSLAEEQTGANLHSGTGSFIRAIESYGLPGAFSGDTSQHAIMMQETSPLYLAESSEEGHDSNPSGPDTEDDGQRVIDREVDDFQRFINEMDRLFDSEPLPQTQGQVTFDFFNRLNAEPPYLPANFAGAVSHIMPLLHRQGYRVNVIVWAPTPSPSAWERVTRQAAAIADQIASLASLPPERREQLQSSGMPWLYSDVKRPNFSIVVSRVGDR